MFGAYRACKAVPRIASRKPSGLSGADVSRPISKRPSIGYARPRSCLESRADALGSRTLVGTASHSILGCCHPEGGPRSESRRGPTRELCRARLPFVPGRSLTNSTSAVALGPGCARSCRSIKIRQEHDGVHSAERSPPAGIQDLDIPRYGPVHSTRTEYPYEPLPVVPSRFSSPRPVRDDTSLVPPSGRMAHVTHRAVNPLAGHIRLRPDQQRAGAVRRPPDR
jgi:hypothetical protein